jgi:hypothetical protein
MKITPKYLTHLSNRVAIELNRSGLVKLVQGLEPISKEAAIILEADMKKELALEERVNEILEDHLDDIDDALADERQLFFMIKKKIADEYGVILNYEERFSDISHKILDAIYEEDLINYDVTENRVKNIIYEALTSFIADNNEIDNAVTDKIHSYKREIIPGTEDYEILYERLYKEELIKRGMA